MKAWGDLGAILILGLYYVDKGKNVEIFTRRFNKYFSLDISVQTILRELSRIKCIDPFNNINKKEIVDSEYLLLWKQYISQDRILELKELYNEFKKEKFIDKSTIDDDGIVDISNFIETPEKVIDQPMFPSHDYTCKDQTVYRRHKHVVVNALTIAEYKCEALCNTDLFIRKNTLVTYTEAHHLIPLCFQNSFEYSLDVEANVVSLCPNCHRKLHYGKDNIELLKKLFESRKNRLAACNLNIKFEDLILMYR